MADNRNGVATQNPEKGKTVRSRQEIVVATSTTTRAKVIKATIQSQHIF